MLQTLHIENVAVIKEADIDFDRGFSVLSGQTGAGKSILIDSINFLLGAHIGKELLRTGANSASVRALFTDIDGATAEKLTACGVPPDENRELLLERTINKEGRSSAKANCRPVTLSLLKAAGRLLVNIHGQNETHTLTERENHLSILDRFAESASCLEAYGEKYRELCELRKLIRSISESEGERLREIEMLRYQVTDIESYALKEGEEEKLRELKLRLKNSERINKQASFAYRALKGGEKANALYILERSVASVRTLSDVIPEADEIADRLEECHASIEDAAERIYAFYDGEEDGTRRLNAIEGRLDAIEKLRRKYGNTVSDILAFCQKAKERLGALDDADGTLSEYKAREEALRVECEGLAKELHDRRLAASARLQDGVLSVLSFLDMPKVRFEVSAKTAHEDGNPVLRRDGFDEVEFLLAANPGEPLLPLSSIASGGELARIMLAIKSVIADKDGVGTVIYDEIDSGVSGKTARKIGISLLRSARGVQVLCVTHSAQIASLANTHYLIAKEEKDGRAETSVSPLDEEGRINELSRILGGIEVTEAQRAAARELYTERSVYKED